jgi:hypothetical protein
MPAYHYEDEKQLYQNNQPRQVSLEELELINDALQKLPLPIDIRVCRVSSETYQRMPETTKVFENVVWEVTFNGGGRIRHNGNRVVFYNEDSDTLYVMTPIDRS